MSNSLSLIIISIIVIGLLYSCYGAITEGLMPPTDITKINTAETDSSISRSNNSVVRNVQIHKENAQHVHTLNQPKIIKKITDIEDPGVGSVFYPSSKFYIFADVATIPKKQSQRGFRYPGTYNIWDGEATAGRRDHHRERRRKAHNRRHARHKLKRYHR